MLKSFGFIPIFFALSIFVNYLIGWNFIFSGQTVYPNPFFALLLFVSGIVWTLWFQKRAK